MAKGPKKPIPNDPEKSNWVEAGGGLPSYIRRIAEHLHGQGHTVSQAIAIAVSQVKKWAAGGENVKPDTRAKAAAALAAWEGVKAKAKAKTALKEAARFEYLRMTPHECQEAGAAFAARLAIVEGLLLSTAGERVPSAAVSATRDLLEGRAVRMVLRSPPARAVDVLDARVRLSREARDLRELAEALGAKVEPAEKPRPLPHDADPTRTTQLQNRLTSLGHGLVGDGHYGPKTDAAVRLFQTTQGLKDDGIVGEKTTEMLRAPGAPVGSSLDAEDISADPMDEPEGRDNAPASVLFKGVGVGERSGIQQVRDLQVGLGDVGYAVEQDGRFGPQTDQAVKRMQRRYGLKADGIYGAKTQRTLKAVQGRNKRMERDALRREVGMGLSEAETRMEGRSCPACASKKVKGKCPDCGWSSESYKAGRKLTEGKLNAAQRRASATIQRDGGKFPIPDKGHAKAALGRINQSDLSDAEKAKVRAKAKKVLSESEQAGRELAETWSQAARDAALLARRMGRSPAPALKGRAGGNRAIHLPLEHANQLGKVQSAVHQITVGGRVHLPSGVVVSAVDRPSHNGYVIQDKTQRGVHGITTRDPVEAAHYAMNAHKAASTGAMGHHPLNPKAAMKASRKLAGG